MCPKKYRALVELAPDPIFLIDPSTGTVVEVNDAATSLLDYDKSSLEGMPVTDFHPADQTDAYRSLFEQSFDDTELQATALPDGNQLYLVTRAGERIPVELHARKIDVAGDPLIYTIARDITPRYEHEQELERQKNRFETFAKVVSHDLRSPLEYRRRAGRTGC